MNDMNASLAIGHLTDAVLKAKKGMTPVSLRAHFAGLAMKAHYQEQIAVKIREGIQHTDGTVCLSDRRLAVIAECSYKMADAMLAVSSDGATDND